MKSDLTAPPVVILPTNLAVVGATEDLLLELTVIELGATELGATELLGTELGATELGAIELPGMELGVALEDRTDETAAPPHTVPFIVGRSAVAPFLLP